MSAVISCKTTSDSRYPIIFCFSEYLFWLEDKLIYFLVFSDPTCDGDHLEQNVLFSNTTWRHLQVFLCRCNDSVSFKRRGRFYYCRCKVWFCALLLDIIEQTYSIITWRCMMCLTICFGNIRPSRFFWTHPEKLFVLTESALSPLLPFEESAQTDILSTLYVRNGGKTHL